jgi:hypothetical protein
MTALPFILSSVLAGAAAGMLLLLVIGIHRDDRAKTLTQPAHSRTEAATRRLLGVGVRTTQASDREEASGK